MTAFAPLLLLALSAPASAPAAAPPPAASAPAAEAPAVDPGLIALREGLVDAVNRGDIDKIAAALDPGVTVVWHTGDFSQGVPAVREYCERMMKSPGAPVKSLRAEVEVDARDPVAEGVVVTSGRTREHYTLARGIEFELDGRWTAVMVRGSDGWKIRHLALSHSILDNPLLAEAKRRLLGAGALGLVVGLLAGAVAVALLRRR